MIQPMSFVSAVLLVSTVGCGGPSSGADAADEPEAPDASPPLDRHLVTAEGISCAYRVGGMPRCWGSNASAQLAADELVDHPVPITVEAEPAVEVLGVGSSRACAIHRDATAWCWGATGYGMLGDGSPTENGGLRPDPTKVATDVPLVSLRMGWLHTCGLTTVGTAHCWGYNAEGQLGDGSLTNAGVPVAAAAYDGDFITDASLYYGTLFVDRDGHVETFGEDRYRATSIASVPDVISYAYAGVSACALRANGEVWCAGLNNYGVVGVPPTGEQCSGLAGPADCVTTPVQVPLPQIAALSFGGVNVCARTATGEGYCWGANTWGTLGDGTMTQPYAPVRIVLPEGRTIRELAVSTHICALANDDTVWCWGKNEHGQVGDGATGTNVLSPVQVPIEWD